MDNKTLLLVLMIVLIVFIVLLAVLGIVFIIALRKRAPVVKVVMAPMAHRDETPAPAAAPAAETTEDGEAAPAPAPEPEPEPEEPENDDDDDEETTSFITEGSERVRYNRSMMAKLSQLKNESKEWYTELKNELLSYDKVKDRMSWKRESFRLGRMTVARLVIRGKTLCLMLAVEASGYSGTKYTVEDVSNTASTADTPTLFRIKSVRRLKYAKEMIAGMMKELKVYKDTHFEAQDYFVPYEGDMALMQKGYIKRIVSAGTKTFKIEEVDKAEAEAAQTEANAQAEAAATDDKPEEKK